MTLLHCQIILNLTCPDTLHIEHLIILLGQKESCTEPSLTNSQCLFLQTEMCPEVRTCYRDQDQQ